MHRQGVQKRFSRATFRADRPVAALQFSTRCSQCDTGFSAWEYMVHHVWDQKTVRVRKHSTIQGFKGALGAYLALLSI